MKEKHVHKLKKIKYKSGNATFFCALPDCSFKINPALALGKRSICWRCGNEFIMSEYSLRLAKPHCENCHKPKKLEELDLSRKEIFDMGEQPAELSLQERLQQTIKQAQHEQEEEI